jgi:P pilus assembly chaperone PapD
MNALNVVRIFVLAALAVVAASSAHAQTIAPLVSEYQREARGRVEITNNGDVPLNVVLQPKGFSVDEAGEMRDEPFPAHVEVTLSAMSFRLPPRQSRFVFYEAKTNRAPAWFVLYAVLSGYPQRDFSGINVELELPHVVYILPREKWQAGDVRVADTRFNRETGKLELLVKNDGAMFGRVTEVQVSGRENRVKVPGFPLFPGATRRVEVAWTGPGQPDMVEVDAPNVSFRHRIPPLAR